MANTLTNLIPDAYAALEVVSRELAGTVLAVTRDSRADRVALNQTLRIPISPANTAGADYTPAMSVPAAADQTIDHVTMTISKNRKFPFSWSGEEEYSINQGVGVLNLQQAQIAQAMRAAVNEMETDINNTVYKLASRAYGTAGTAPFGTAGDYSDAAQVRKILADNGAPLSDLQLVVDTAAGANIRGKQAQAQMAGDVTLQRQGVLLDYAGFAIRESGAIALHTAGTGSAYDVNQPVTAPAVGDTQIAFDTGSGTVVAGDVIVNAETGRDANKYVVNTALGGGHLHINKPGLRLAWVDGDTITLAAAYRANLAFARTAILFATRLPSMPRYGDMATDSEVIVDPRTGLAFEIRYYPGDGMGLFRLHVCWGITVIQPEHIAILLG